MGQLLKIGLFGVAVYWGLSWMDLNPFTGGEAEAAIDDLRHEAVVSGRDKIVVLLTGTSWCPYCVDLDREVIQTLSWRQFASRDIIFEIYDYAAGEGRSGLKGDLLERFDVAGLPAMVVMDEGGNVLGERVGYSEMGAKGYQEWVESL
ncbi:MAG: thioredoxin family protein [Verrucomicrobiota bacterium]